MGIKKLNKFLNEKSLVKTYPNLGNFVKEKRNTYITNGNIVIAIDLLLYLYKYSYAYESFIIGFWNQISMFLTHRVIPFYIIDTKCPNEKLPTVKLRNKKEENLENKLETIKTQLENVQKDLNIDDKIINFLTLEKHKLEKKIIKIKKNDIDLLKDFFDEINIPYAESASEADMLCGKLFKEGTIVSCLSDDMDMLCFGCKSVIKIQNNKVYEYNLDFILKSLQLTNDQFIEMCLLFGCDYLKPNFKMEINDIYKNIKKYGSINEIITKNIYTNFNNERSKYFVEKYLNIKKIFTDYQDKNVITVPSIESKLKISIILYYLTEYTSLDIENIDRENIERCVSYINNHIDNKLLYNARSFKYLRKFMI